MTLPVHPNQISLDNIRTEFPFEGPVFQTSLATFYRGLARVPEGTIGYPGGVETVVPASGQIAFSNFHGAIITGQQGMLQPPTPDLGSNLNFGYSVSISGDGNTIVIGAPGGNDAYVYEKSGASWVYTATLDTPGTGEFGYSVSMISEGDRILVGSPALNTINPEVGEAYYYKKSGALWISDGTVPKVETSASQRYGHSVSLIRSADFGDPRATIGIPGFNSNVGRATQRTRNASDTSWSGGLLTLTASSTGQYGFSVAQSAASERYVIVGAPFSNSVQTSAGAAYIESFGYDETPLIPSDLTASSLFGWSVAITPDATTALVGAPNEGPNRGAVYVYTRSGTTWSQQAKLVPNPRVFDGLFGYSVAISHNGNLALIGSPGAPAKFYPYSTGKIYYFSRSGSTWTEQASYTATTADQFSYFGRSVSLSADGRFAVVGSQLSYWPSYIYDSIGAAFIFFR